jgi:anionic cell wall polymer biosynthesis LytR-Cps2A-Psr (LCP) family protein
MARQRCFLSALADQVDPFGVLRNFESLAHTVERNVRTDIPLNRFPRLVRLATAVDRRSTLTVTFGRDYIANRRKSDNFPRPNVPRIRATVREALLHPSDTAAGAVSVARDSC